jgi:hypothetical protein
MADKYLKQASGKIVEQEVLQSSLGAGSAGKLIGLDGTGRLDETFMPVGIGAEVKIFEATENLAGGNWVNIYDDSGILKVRKADATTSGKEAHGFVLAPVDIGVDTNATVYFTGINDELSGLTGGVDRYLSATTAGACTATPPAASGNIVQRIGTRLSATEVVFSPMISILIA